MTTSHATVSTHHSHRRKTLCGMLQLGLLLSLLLLLLPLASCQDSTGSDKLAALFGVEQNDEPLIQCPIYRIFDPDAPQSPQYGAPSGCRCVDGMQGLNCGYCDTNDAPCQQAHGEDYVCSTSTAFALGETYKSLRCKLTSALETLFPNGKISAFLDVANRSASLIIYNQASLNEEHAIDCNFWDCEFALGQTGGMCANSLCHCTDWCSEWTTTIVETVISGNPVQVVIDPLQYEHHLKVIMEGAPLEIEALCNASYCADPSLAAPEGSTSNNTNTSDFSAEYLASLNMDSAWSSSATFSLIVLCFIAGVFLFLVCFAAAPFLLGKRSLARSKEERQQRRRSSHHREESADQEELIHQSWEDDTEEGRSVTIILGDTVTTADGGGDGDGDCGGSVKAANNNDELTLEFRHLSRVVELRPAAAKAYGKPEKVILNNISGKVEAGTLMGIMGPSGSGKSSLLNILAAVESGRSRISGQILLNGKLQKTGYRTAVAYVQQDDSLYETLTVHECVEYSAMLRLPRSMKIEEKDDLVWKTLEELHLAEIAHNRIGSTGKSNAGVSGGERKRVSVGMELVSQARILVLDEPTSGLDSHAANNIINVLSELASKNRIVILSIHQPSMKSFLAMDKILLLGKGRVMYNGKPSEVGAYLEDQGFPCPPLETVADHMLTVVSDRKNREVLKGPDILRRDYEDLSNSHKAAEHDDEDSAGGDEMRVERQSLLNEIVVLLFRTGKDIFRNRELFLLQLTISIILALFAGGIFNDVSNNLAGFQNRMGVSLFFSVVHFLLCASTKEIYLRTALSCLAQTTLPLQAFYFTLSFFAFASFSSMDIFVRERHIFVRESGSKYHLAFSYFVAKILLDTFVLRVIPVTIFTFVFYWMMGLRAEPEIFVTFWATLVLFNVCAGTISICISIATPAVGQANLIAAVWFLIMLLFGGFLVNVQTMSPWFAWLRYTSIFYYSFEILMTNELSGLMLSFDAPGYPPLPVYGEVFLHTIGMETDNQTRDLICLCTLAAAFSIAAYLLLLLRVPPSAARQFQKMHRENKELSRMSDEDYAYTLAALLKEAEATKCKSTE